MIAHALFVALFFGLAGSFFVSIVFLRRRRDCAEMKILKEEQEEDRVIRSAFPHPLTESTERSQPSSGIGSKA